MNLSATRHLVTQLAVVLTVVCLNAQTPPSREVGRVDATSAQDPRNISHGRVLPDEDYCDQPYVVTTADGAWLCVMTTGSKHEGSSGQHVVAIRSLDQGRTWSQPVDIEPVTGPVASWGMPLVTSFGRVYVFYSYNGDRITGRRADMLGWYCYRYSDDGGLSWSERHRLPLRQTAADRGNDWKGEVQIFWGIGKPIVVGGTAIFGFTKIGRYMLDESEGWFFRSENVMTERDVAKIRWDMLPEGDHGLRAMEHGSVQSEQNLVSLSNGDLYCMYRTTMGYPCHAYSRDGGKTWTRPVAATYTPDGRRFKHPRACPRLWKTRSGRYLFWFHNNGHKDWSSGTRNPCWLVGGVERDGFIHWSQPEIVLYDPDESVRISYPDLIEKNGRYWITETQKSVARVHEIDAALLEGLWNQGKVTHVDNAGLTDASKPVLADLDAGGGFTLDIQFVAGDPSQARTLVQARSGNTELTLVAAGGLLTLTAREGQEKMSWSCDPGLLQDGQSHHAVIVADGGPGILTWILDGVLCDGGDRHVRGWQRFRSASAGGSRLGSTLRAVSGSAFEPDPTVRSLRMYARALRTSEAIASDTASKRARE